MKKTLSFRVYLTLALMLSILSVCRGDRVELGKEFTVVEVRVIDNLTGSPVAGALVKPVCLGGTPYATNSYHTDVRGVARVVSYRGLTAVRVTTGGYKDSFVTFFPPNGSLTNAVVKLQPIPG
jgi:hypothetical protein